MEKNDLSDDILFEEFRNFYDIELLNTAQVNERFKEITRKVVAEKYNGDTDDKYFNVKVASTERIYVKFFEIFGNQITALKLVSKKGTNKKILNLVSKYCHNVKYVVIESEKELFPVSKIICSMSNLTDFTLKNLKCSDLCWIDERFPRLKILSLESVINLNVEMFLSASGFLYINSQLKILKIANCPSFPLKGLHLSNLKCFDFMAQKYEFINKCIDIRAKNLESLKISTDRSSTADVLSVFSKAGKMIRNLEVSVHGYIDATLTFDKLSNTIGLFEKLTTLKLINFMVGMRLIKNFAQCLPNLMSLHLDGVQLGEIPDMSTDDILNVFEICQKLTVLKLEHGTYRITDYDQINLEFYGKLVALGRQRGNKIKLELIQPNEKVLITEEKIVQNGELRYWSGYDASLSRSDVHLFDLSDQALEKMFNYLDESAQHALYQTCNKMKNALQERIKSQWFTVSDETTAIDLFSRFDEHITKLAIDMKTDDSLQMVDTWKLISDNYSKQITEMSMKNVRIDATGNVPAEFPHLSKLNVHSIVPSSAHIFPLMNCPKLAQLEFCGNKTLIEEDELDFPSRIGITLNNLTIIKLTNFDDNMEKTLNRFDDKICNQIQEFTAEKVQSRMVNAVNIAMRFRNLIKLNIVDYYLNRSNFEFLFQNCIKLERITLFESICYDSENFCRILQFIKENCKQLTVLQLIKNDADYNQTYLIDIKRYLPNVILKRFLYDEGRDTYKDHTCNKQKCPF